jgi:hypothetical protein
MIVIYSSAQSIHNAFKALAIQARDTTQPSGSDSTIPDLGAGTPFAEHTVGENLGKSTRAADQSSQTPRAAQALAENRFPASNQHFPAGQPSVGNPAPRPAEEPLIDAHMVSRVEAYKRMIADADSIIGKGLDGTAMPSPLLVRAWLFNIGLAFDMVKDVLREAEASRCAPIEERIQKILEIFDKTGVMPLVINVIRTKASYDAESARAEAERLIRYGFSNSIAK